MNENSNKRVSQALSHGGDCPALDELIDLTSGKNGEERRLQAEAHVAGCAHCATELALFREFEEPHLRPEEKADVEAIVARLRRNSPVARASWWKSIGKSIGTWQWMAPASVALAAVLVGLFVWAPGRTTSGTAPVVSGGDDVMRSARVEVVGPMGTLVEAPAKLEWTAAKGAVRYRVTLSEVDQTEVWSGTVENSNASLPADVIAKVVPRKTFIWRVSALNQNGAVIAESGSQRFVVEPRPNQ